MDYTYQWIDPQVPSLREEFEHKIGLAIKESDDPMFTPCHSGTVTIHLAITGPLLTELKGVFKCSCGKNYVAISGADNASTVNFTPLK